MSVFKIGELVENGYFLDTLYIRRIESSTLLLLNYFFQVILSRKNHMKRKAHMKTETIFGQTLTDIREKRLGMT